MGLFSFLNPSTQTKHTLKPGSAARDIVVPVDDSRHSLEVGTAPPQGLGCHQVADTLFHSDPCQALEWAVTNIYRPDRADQLHLLSVVPRVAGPYPAEVRLCCTSSPRQVLGVCLQFVLNTLFCVLWLQVLEADVPAASSSTVKAWRSEQHAHESETEALLSFMQHHAVNLGVSVCWPHNIHECWDRGRGRGRGSGKRVRSSQCTVLLAGAEVRPLAGGQPHIPCLHVLLFYVPYVSTSLHAALALPVWL